MTVRQAISMGKSKRIFMKSNYHFCEAIWQLLGIFRTRQAGHLIVTAWAVAGEHRHFVRLFIFAAVGDVSVVMLVFLFHKATAGVVGAFLG